VHHTDTRDTTPVPHISTGPPFTPLQQPPAPTDQHLKQQSGCEPGALARGKAEQSLSLESPLPAVPAPAPTPAEASQTMMLKKHLHESGASKSIVASANDGRSVLLLQTGAAELSSTASESKHARTLLSILPPPEQGKDSSSNAQDTVVLSPSSSSRKARCIASAGEFSQLQNSRPTLNALLAPVISAPCEPVEQVRSPPPATTPALTGAHTELSPPARERLGPMRSFMACPSAVYAPPQPHVCTSGHRGSEVNRASLFVASRNSVTFQENSIRNWVSKTRAELPPPPPTQISVQGSTSQQSTASSLADLDSLEYEAAAKHSQAYLCERSIAFASAMQAADADESTSALGQQPKVSGKVSRCARTSSGSVLCRCANYMWMSIENTACSKRLSPNLMLVQKCNTPGA
jgi:hypothetical protein